MVRIGMWGSVGPAVRGSRVVVRPSEAKRCARFARTQAVEGRSVRSGQRKLLLEDVTYCPWLRAGLEARVHSC